MRCNECHLVWLSFNMFDPQLDLRAPITCVTCKAPDSARPGNYRCHKCLNKLQTAHKAAVKAAAKAAARAVGEPKTVRDTELELHA